MDILSRKEITNRLFWEEVFKEEERSKNVPFSDQPQNPKCGKFSFPKGLEPVPLPLQNRPDKSDPLPSADIVIVTWTVDEQDALADVFAHPFVRPTFYKVDDERREKFSWYAYDRFFKEKYKNKIRGGAPSLGTCKNPKNQLGNYFLCKVGEKTILLFKSELHLNQDGIYLNGDGSMAGCQDRYIDETSYSTN